MGRGRTMAGTSKLASLTLAVIAGLLLISQAAIAKPQPGELDRSFGGDGVVNTRVNGMKAYAASVAIDPNNRIVAAGSNTNGFQLARYRPNGGLDPSFSGDGMASVAFHNIDPVGASVAIGKGGTVTVAGGTCRNTARCQVTVARLTPDGELDPAFGNGGKVTIRFGWATENGLSMALDSRGRVVVAGTTCKQHGAGHCDFGVVRLKQDGRFDQSFGKGDGKVAANIAPHSRKAFVSLNAMAIDSRGRIILAGDRSRPNRVVLVRDKENGSRDRSFGHHGIVEKSLDRLGGIQGIAITPKDKIVAAGTYQPNAYRKWALARFGRSGGLDRSFGKGGETAVRIPGGNDEVNAVALDSKNRIVVTGKPAYSLARLRPNGGLDRSFGHHGTVVKDLGEGWSQGVAIDSQNRPVVVGGYPDFLVARFLG
jgi:uncharacterized delta-60 repeat protein